MNPKVLFPVVMVMAILPFIITSFVMDQTKRSVGVFFGLLVGITALWAFGQTSYGAPGWIWLHDLHHVLFVLAACWFLIALTAVGAMLRRRGQLRRLQWTRQPTQQQFGKICLAYLNQSGWRSHGRLSRTFIDIERMSRGSRKATFMFSAHPFPLEAVRRLMSQTVWRAHGRMIVISWRDEVPGMKAIAEKMGWRCVSVDQLRKEEEQDERA